ncbi:MAG: hypothetical protein V3T22_12425, partial [Planctomycetota bacterium]
SAQVLPGELLLNSFQNPSLLVHYRPDGTLVKTGAGTGILWEGAAILPDGKWVTSRRNNKPGVNIFDGVTGLEITSWDMPGFSGAPGDVGVFSDGTIAVVQLSGMVWRFDTAGNVIASWSVSERPFGILVDDQDEVWTCDVKSGLLWHTDDQGQKINAFSTGTSAGDVTMAADGTLFVTRRNNGEVAHYAPDGTFLGAFMATGNLGTSGIAMGEDQTLWVTGEAETLLRNFDQAGKLLGSFHVGIAIQPLFLTIAVSSPGDIGTNYCGPANLNSTGQSALLSAFGSTRAFKNLVTLTARQLPQDVFGYFLNSDVQGFQPFPPGSQGNLCLGGDIGRHAKQVANTGAVGELVIDLDLEALPRPNGTHSVLAGETWNFQCWFRDKNPGPTSNFTDGIEIVFR